MANIKYPYVTNRSSQPVFYRLEGGKDTNMLFIEVIKFYGFKETKQGWWCVRGDQRSAVDGLYLYDEKDKMARLKETADPVFLLKNGASKLAKPTLEEAADAYRSRKYWHELFARQRYLSSSAEKFVANNLTGEDFEKLRMLGKLSVNLKETEWQPTLDSPPVDLNSAP